MAIKQYDTCWFCGSTLGAEYTYSNNPDETYIAEPYLDDYSQPICKLCLEQNPDSLCPWCGDVIDPDKSKVYHLGEAYCSIKCIDQMQERGK